MTTGPKNIDIIANFETTIQSDVERFKFLTTIINQVETELQTVVSPEAIETLRLTTISLSSELDILSLKLAEDLRKVQELMSFYGIPSLVKESQQ